MEEPDKELGQTFNSVPDLYDAHRPDYPEEMVDEVIYQHTSQAALEAAGRE